MFIAVQCCINFFYFEVKRTICTNVLLFTFLEPQNAKKKLKKRNSILGVKPEQTDVGSKTAEMDNKTAEMDTVSGTDQSAPCDETPAPTQSTPCNETPAPAQSEGKTGRKRKRKPSISKVSNMASHILLDGVMCGVVSTAFVFRCKF